MEINRTQTNENQTSFESNPLTFVISIIHIMVIILFALFLSAIIYWHYMDQSFPIFSFIRWGIIIAGLITGVMLTIVFKREYRITGKSISYFLWKKDIYTSSKKFTKPGK